MKERCTICGREDDAYWMHEINTGRRTLYECRKCYVLGQREVGSMNHGFLKQYKRKEDDRRR